LTDAARTILGLDPGLALLGYGVIRVDGDTLTHLEHGCVETPAGTPLPVRLQMLYSGLQLLLGRHTITDVAMEALFHSRNVTTAVVVGEARGVALLATVRGDVEFAEYTPSAVKQIVAGYGKATKRQVQEMMRMLFGLRDLPSPDDAADALAVAVCHARQMGVRSLVDRAIARA
jgi:crossover junction endodeoxyribonuclease RuvC